MPARLREPEADFQVAVIELARLLGWRVAHFRPARTERGWRTAVAADGKGFVDLTMVRLSVIFVELKAENGQVSPDQQAWHDALRRAGAEVHVWRPSHWKEIECRLRRG